VSSHAVKAIAVNASKVISLKEFEHFSSLLIY
jgi:hypothetical protein